MPGILIPFFNSGPFAWNGLFSFWLVLNIFFLWLILNYVYTVKAIRAQQASEQRVMRDSVGTPGTVGRKVATA